MPDWTREDRLIEQFGTRLSEVDGWSVRILDRPDRDGRGRGGCDAILELSRRVALEHTTIDSFEGQRQDDARCLKLNEMVKESVEAAFPSWWIEISIPTGAIPTGIDWSALGTGLSEACLRAIPALPADDEAHGFDFPGIPFPVRISRGSDFAATGCCLLRFAPKDQQAQLVEVIATRIREKKSRASFYSDQGLPLLLLLDSIDPLRASRRSLARAFRQVADREGVEEFDEVWLATAHYEPRWFIPLKIGDRIYPDLPDFDRYVRAQFDLTRKGM